MQEKGSEERIVKDVASRIKYSQMKWQKCVDPLKVKRRFYKTIIRPAIMYGSECCILNNKQEIKTKVSKMRSLRWMYSVNKLEKIMNEYTRGSLGITDVAVKMVDKKLA